ncbi:MAG: GlsB/YeaQ/YmgE family stress response rane protein [Conexibacter sp.]|jgi:uncharacterized membrane protein YeaQ/YmgE (transglycosylase-associated protein family)|nr:GlsB/YeaQ/YmgE family stress response rane protein [Conexibacter sp.]
MGLLLFIILLAFSGLVVGALGRLALPGPDPMSIWATIGIGLVASLIAGFAVYAITGNRNGGSFIASVLVATLLVYLVRRSRGQTAWSTRRDPRQTRF